jgi:hypothetical protein
VVLRQSVGALFRRMSREFSGDLCRACAVERYFAITVVNRTLGMLGLISICLGVVYDFGNLRSLLRIRRLGRAHRPPVLWRAIGEALQDGVQDFLACLGDLFGRSSRR